MIYGFCAYSCEPSSPAHVSASRECITLKIGPGCWNDRFWHFHVQGPVIIVPPPVVSLWAVTCRLALCLRLYTLVQLAESDTVVLMTRCFAHRRSQ